MQQKVYFETKQKNSEEQTQISQQDLKIGE